MEVTCIVKSEVPMTVTVHILFTYEVTKCSKPEGLSMEVFLYLQLQPILYHFVHNTDLKGYGFQGLYMWDLWWTK
jgi:hypothetical protein